MPPVASRKESLLACAFIIVLVLGPAILATRAQGETRAAATTRQARVPACLNCLRESACESLPELPAVNSGESREVGATFQVGCPLLVAPRKEASKNVHPPSVCISPVCVSLGLSFWPAGRKERPERPPINRLGSSPAISLRVPACKSCLRELACAASLPAQVGRSKRPACAKSHPARGCSRSAYSEGAAEVWPCPLS